MNRSTRSVCWDARCRRRRCVVPTGICRAARPTTCIGWGVTSNAQKARCACIEACSEPVRRGQHRQRLRHARYARATAGVAGTADGASRTAHHRGRRRVVEQELWQVLFDPESPDGLAKVLGNVARTADLVRERLSADAWRILENLTRMPEVPWRARAIGDAVKLLNTMIQNVSAITGMIQENMTRGYGWRLLDMGRRIERTRFAARLVRALTTQGEPAESGVLNLLLELVDSTMTYRSRYKSLPQLPAVLDLVMSDESNPRSLIFQIAEIEEHLFVMPLEQESGPVSDAQKIVISLLAELRLADVKKLASCAARHGMRTHLDRVLTRIELGADELSDVIERTYFSHSLERQVSGSARPAVHADVIYDISHDTIFNYANRSAFRISCCGSHRANLPRQTPVHNRVIVEPAPVMRQTRNDFFGNEITYLTVQVPHERLTIRSASRVDVQPFDAALLDDGPAWETSQQRWIRPPRAKPRSRPVNSHSRHRTSASMTTCAISRDETFTPRQGVRDSGDGLDGEDSSRFCLRRWRHRHLDAGQRSAREAARRVSGLRSSRDCRAAQSRIARALHERLSADPSARTGRSGSSAPMLRTRGWRCGVRTSAGWSSTRPTT